MIYNCARQTAAAQFSFSLIVEVRRMALRKLCIAPGCDELAEPGGNRCGDCQAVMDARIAARKAAAKESAVAQVGAALYKSKAWKAAAKGFLAKHPLCVSCSELGLVAVAAAEVDHIIPHRGDRKVFWNRRNWQSLCKPCHSRKTAREVFGQRKGAGG